MQDNNYTLPHERQDELTPDYLDVLQQENQRLLLENEQLKKSLEKEEFLHKNLYRQWTELNARAVIKKHELRQSKLKRSFRKNFYKYSFYVLLLITVVIAFYLFSKGDKYTVSSNTLANTDSIVPAMRQVQEQQNLPAENIKPIKDTVSAQPKPVTSINEPPASKTQETDPGKISAQYRVKTKSFFYNSPDESTRRNTFLLPYKDAYGIITALDDKDGFIYITYTNHRGRTSKGWIRKIDLDPVDQ